MTVNSKGYIEDTGVEILPVHRLKLKWLVHRKPTLSSKYKAFIFKLNKEWMEWEAETALPETLELLDRVYEVAIKIKREFGI